MPLKTSTTSSKAVDSKPESKEKPFYLSVSRVNLFEQCPAKYRYKYIEKLPDRSSYQSATGTFLHKALELFVLEYIKSKDLRASAQKAFILAKNDPEIQELKDLITPEMTSEVKNWIKEYVVLLEKYPEKMPSFLQAETKFSFQIEKTSFVVNGFIDRIDQLSDNTIRVVDYKTTTNPAYLDPFQLVVYTIPTQRMFPGKTVIGSYELARHKFDEKRYEITDTDREAAIDKIVSVGTQIEKLIEADDPHKWKPRPSYLCNYCPFRVQCAKDHSSSWTPTRATPCQNS